MKVFLTGASSGIGEALARHYASRGATLGLVARRGELLRTLRDSLGVPAEIFAADVGDNAALKAAGDEFMARHGVPDVVIANAGVSYGTLTEIARDSASFRDILDVNVVGLVNTFHPFVEPMRARGGGTLAGIASVAGFRGLPGSSGYSASKAAAIAYLEALRLEMPPSGLQVPTATTGSWPLLRRTHCSGSSGLAFISWCGPKGGTQMKSPGPASAVNSRRSPQRMRALPLTT